MTNLPVPQFPTVSQPMLLEHAVNGGEVVHQRPIDGYVNATELCQKSGKLFGNYHQLARTKAFLGVLSADIGIPISALVQVVKGGNDKLSQDTWVHPRVAINLGQWISPEFDVKVSEWVFDWMEGRLRGQQPVHVQRYMKNHAKVPHAYFSMLNEIYLGLLAPLEDYGIIPPDKMMPDISTGLMFSRFLRGKGIETEQFPTYEHEFIDARRPTVKARLYPIEHLADFRKYFHEVWLPERAEDYFAKKFPNALPYLPAIQQLPPGTVGS